MVQPGDTLGDIAKRYGVDYNDIAKDNNISDPNYILPGQELTINSPKSNDTSSNVSNSSSISDSTSVSNVTNNSYDIPGSTSTPEPTTIKYIIQPGDTLGDIAKKYGLDYNNIAKDNNISDPNYIITGQEIIINIKK